VLLILAAWAAVAQQPSSSSKPRPHPKPTPNLGELREGVYRNPTFGFTYDLPFGWVERTQQMRQDSSGAPKSLVLLSAFERPPEATGDTVNSAVLIVAESVASYPGLKSEEDYLGPLTEVATSKGFRIADEPAEIQLGGTRLVRSDFTKDLGKLTMYQASLVTLHKDYVVSFTFIGANEDEVQSLIEGLQFGSPPKTGKSAH
jgi:hypothetical protein